MDGIKSLTKAAQVAKENGTDVAFIRVSDLNEVLRAVAAKTEGPCMPINMPAGISDAIKRIRKNYGIESGSALIYKAIRDELEKPTTMFVFYSQTSEAGPRIYKYVKKERAESARATCIRNPDTWSNTSDVSEVPFDNSDNRVNKH
jgi:hypothetical protein